MSHYDIVGDIHGYAETLITLLVKLGYAVNDEGYYSHPNRKMIFVGDFIDRGKAQKKVIGIVRPMIENGAALAVMGNHEFNAISYHTPHSQTGEPHRSHSESHQEQHQAFLEEYSDQKEIDNVISWFKTLPLYLELNEIRVIHACWNDNVINLIRSELDENHCLTDEFVEQANKKNSPQFNAVETLLKGKEIPLPDNICFKDNYGKCRYDIRIKWWSETAKTYHEYALVPGNAIDMIPHTPVPDELLSAFDYPENEKPVFFGHYWFTGEPVRQKANVACLDYSIGKSDKLVAYRWSVGDTGLLDENFVMVNACDRL
jgi:hypothetical protein